MANRLQDSTSPYLRQHADNPVDWYPWGQEAFDAALAGDRPVLVSIGYSACHWCHVMAHESFENPAVARLMNEQFVNIKVDREERPDVDSVYMDAVQALTGQGGWPLNIFVTPDRRPFFGGTYWPPAPRHGMPSWPQVLQSIALAWRNDRKQVDQTAASLLEQIGRSNELEQSSDPLTVAILNEAFAASTSYFDAGHGGFGGAPKFPQPMNVELLLRTHARTGSAEALDMARLTLDHMAAGGIHDQLGGGFHRYTVDATWTVPHFEKMLYDNAQLARLYTEAWQATHDLAYRRTAEDTLDYLLRDMTSPEGAFYASEDADSGGEEGTFYVWDPEEIARALPPDEAAVFTRRYGVSAQGNFEGKSIPVIAETIDEVARATGQDAGRVAELLDNAARTLMSERAKRPRPGRDDKILTSWNGIAIRAFALAGRAFERPDYLEAATRAAALLLERLRSESDDKGTDAPSGQGRLAHMLIPGGGSQLGFLEDYAFFIEALEELFETTGELRWLEASEPVANSMIARFSDPVGGFFTTDDESERELPTRPKTLTDNALPSGNSSATMGLLRLAALTGKDEFVAPALATLSLVAPALGRHALSFGYMLGALDFHLARKQEIVIVGDPEAETTQAMTATVFGSYLPNTIRVAVRAQAALTSENPLLKGRQLMGDQPAAYVCEDYVCRAPITDPSVLEARVRPSMTGSEPG